jgi:hypothetical protein
LVSRSVTEPESESLQAELWARSLFPPQASNRLNPHKNFRKCNIAANVNKNTSNATILHLSKVHYKQSQNRL